MRSLLILALPLSLIAATFSSTPKAEFEATVRRATDSFDHQDYLGTAESLREALQIANSEFKRTAEAALPRPPRNMQPVQRLERPAPSGAVAVQTPPVASIYAIPLEKSYVDPETSERLRIRLVPNDQRAAQMQILLEQEGQAVTFGDSARPFIFQPAPRRFVVRTVLAGRHGLDIVWYGKDREALENWLATVRLANLEQVLTGR